MSQLSSTPAQQVSVLLERAKSFSLGVRYVTADHQAIDITGSTTLLKVIEQEQYGSGVVLTATAEADGDPVDGHVRFDLQATDLDLAPRIYLFVIVIHAASGYSGVVAKGEIEIFSNGETESLALTYPGINPSQILEVALGDNNSITLSVPSFEYPELLMGGVTTLSPGSDAIAQITGRYPTQILTLSIPRGATGASGVGIAGMAVTSGRLFITLTSGTVIDAGPLPVADGGTAAPTESPEFTGSPTVNGDPIATTSYVDDGDADTLAAAVAADDILEADYIARDAAVTAAADAANDALEADYIARDAAVTAAADAANDALEADYIARDAVLAADIAGHSHGATGMSSTVGAGLPTVTGRNEGDQHYNTTDSKEYVIVGSAAVIAASDDFNGRSGAVGGQTTQVGGLTYVAAAGPVFSGNRVSGTGMVEVPLSPGNQRVALSSFVVPDSGDQTLYLKTNGSGGSTSGYRLTFLRNTGAGSAKMRIYRLGVLVVDTVIGTTAAEPDVEVRLIGQFNAATGTVTFTLEGRTSVTYVDGSPPAGNHAGFLSPPSGTDYVDNFEAGSLDTRVWTSTDEHLPTHTHTLAARSTTSAISTVSAGFPSLVSRLAGDLHRDTTTGRQYVLTGAVGTSLFDDFNRASLGTVSSSGVSYATVGSYTQTNYAISGNKLTKTASHGAGLTVGAFGANIGTGVHEVQCATTWATTGGALNDTMTFILCSPSSLTSANYYKVDFGPNALNSGNAGVRIYRVAAGVATIVATQNFGAGGYGVGTWSVLASVDPTTGLIAVTGTNGTGGAISLSYTDTAPFSGNTYAGLYFDNTSNYTTLYTVDNLYLTAGGTAAWTREDPLYLSAIIPGSATITASAIKPGLRIPEATKARSIVVRADTAPSGGNYTVTLERWNNGAFVTNIGTVTLATTVSINSLTGLSLSLAGGDIIKANVSAVSGAADVLISLDCWA